MAVREFHYRVGAPALGHFPGAHRSTRGDSGFEFRGHASLLDAPDPRRLDLHASLRDPFGNWIVRVYSQRKAVPVVLVADLSASMAFRSEGQQGEGQEEGQERARRKLDVLADFAESLAWSAWRTGDSFGFVGCDDAVRDDWRLPQSRSRGAGATLAQRLRALQPEGRSARGLAQAHRQLGRQRSLVFLASDFHLPLAELSAALSSFRQHELVPVVLWDPAEFTLSAPRGLASVNDPESGRQRFVWWRPALRERWAARADERRAALLDLFRAQRLKPLFVEGGFDAEAVTRHFHS